VDRQHVTLHYGDYHPELSAPSTAATSGSDPQVAVAGPVTVTVTVTEDSVAF